MPNSLFHGCFGIHNKKKYKHIIVITKLFLLSLPFFQESQPATLFFVLFYLVLFGGGGATPSTPLIMMASPEARTHIKFGASQMTNLYVIAIE